MIKKRYFGWGLVTTTFLKNHKILATLKSFKQIGEKFIYEFNLG